jgi:adenylosuccinate synthase
MRRRCEPVFADYEPWDEDLSVVRSFGDLPPAARRYAAGLVRHTLECAYGAGPWPGRLPNVRYLGVGPDPDEIIKDVPGTRELLREAPESPPPA